MELKLMSAFAVTPQKINLSHAALKRIFSHICCIKPSLRDRTSISVLAIYGD
ncbi:hypothetical protein V5094_11575 [Moellerella wisconsensis]|uniref:hypothetical protein n=1 Tax=Moellerella wisconsensis TaxID=158849 RepID=UPI00204902E4|nr:hypothetical protein [Moellerella wisconsensis]UNH28551.1 hypothetical protein MNY64_07135 [Moellerella wisconsensis]WJW83038.1 hypothetical protein QU516_06385 [Moellerella wisconsensis]